MTLFGLVLAGAAFGYVSALAAARFFQIHPISRVAARRLTVSAFCVGIATVGVAMELVANQSITSVSAVVSCVVIVQSIAWSAASWKQLEIRGSHQSDPPERQDADTRP